MRYFFFIKNFKPKSLLFFCLSRMIYFKYKLLKDEIINFIVINDDHDDEEPDYCYEHDPYTHELNDTYEHVTYFYIHKDSYDFLYRNKIYDYDYKSEYKLKYLTK